MKKQQQSDIKPSVDNLKLTGFMFVLAAMILLLFTTPVNFSTYLMPSTGLSLPLGGWIACLLGTIGIACFVRVHQKSREVNDPGDQ